MQRLLATFSSVFLISFLLTFLVWKIAERVGFVSIPKRDRWNRKSVSLGGGIAIFFSVLGGITITGDWVFILGLAPAFFGIFLVGLIDDIWGVSPIGKLVFQFIAATYVVSQGYSFATSWTVLSIVVSVIWIVGMTNSLNLIDNMDGLAAGSAFISSLFLAYLFHFSGQSSLTITALALAAASLGFLTMNFCPAKIFMGDTGSLFLGFMLATLATKLKFISLITHGGFTVIIAIFVLIVPILDTTLVIVSRRSAKRKITTGGRDHTSHRLVSLGLSERKSVFVLYILGILGGVCAVNTLDATQGGLAILTLGLVAASTLFGIFLLEIAVYPIETETVASRIQTRPPGSLPITFLYLIEIALDICVVSLAWLVAHYLRFFDTDLVSYNYYRGFSLVPFLPFVITAKLFSCFIFRLYRGIWRTIWLKDIYRIFKAAALGSLILVGGLALSTRLTDISRVVIIVDWSVTFIGLLGIRTGLIAFRRWFRKMASSPYKAAFLGSSQLLSLVEEATASETRVELAGIITTEEQIGPSDSKILGNADDLENIVLENGIDILLVATEKYEKSLAYLATRGVTIRQIKVHFA